MRLIVLLVALCLALLCPEVNFTTRTKRKSKSSFLCIGIITCKTDHEPTNEKFMSGLRFRVLNLNEFVAHRNLQDDLNDFLALIPTQQIKEIFLSYLANDIEIQDAVTYLKSDEFEGIILTIDAQPAFTNLLKFLFEAGLVNVYNDLNYWRGLLDIPPLTPPAVRRHVRTLRSFLDEILAIIPIEAIKALYYEKLANSPEFKALVDKLSSPEYSALATEVVNLPAVIDLIQRLRAKNVDVDAVFEFFNRLFGWTATPPPPVVFHRRAPVLTNFRHGNVIPRKIVATF